MKGKFDVYLVQPFGKELIFAIVAWSTVRDSLVLTDELKFTIAESIILSNKNSDQNF